MIALPETGSHAAPANTTPPDRTAALPGTDTPRRRGRPRTRLIPPTKRKRGGQQGNRNRWRHGRYSAAAREARATLQAEVAAIEAVIEAALRDRCHAGAARRAEAAGLLRAHADHSHDTGYWRYYT